MTALDDLADIGRSRVFDNLNEIAIIIHNQNTKYTLIIVQFSRSPLISQLTLTISSLIFSMRLKFMSRTRRSQNSLLSSIITSLCIIFAVYMSVTLCWREQVRRGDIRETCSIAPFSFFSSARADITLLDGEDVSDSRPVRDVIESTISRHSAPYSVGYACYDRSR